MIYKLGYYFTYRIVDYGARASYEGQVASFVDRSNMFYEI